MSHCGPPFEFIPCLEILPESAFPSRNSGSSKKSVITTVRLAAPLQVSWFSCNLELTIHSKLPLETSNRITIQMISITKLQGF